MNCSLSSSTRRAGLLAITGFCLGSASFGVAQPDPNWLPHDRLRPAPAVVDPGLASSPDKVGTAPSDAVVLFDGKDLTQWCAMNGSPTKWVVEEGVMKCVPGSGYIRTVQNFGDCQLHVEWMAPTPVVGSSQGRGNSGVFFGMDRYEVQVLDSYQNKTYADGSAASIYCEYPPLINASRPPGQWQSYDIVYTAPRFQPDGKLASPAFMTVFHNGVLVQNHSELTGPTGWLGRAPYEAHPEKQPLSLQDHGNPVRYRNIWVRELGKPGKKEFTFADSLLDSYVGAYEDGAEIKRSGSQLVLTFQGWTFPLFAESPTKFFSKKTDVQCDFKFDDNEKLLFISVGEDGGMKKKKK
jgi:hypothetical protein